MGRLWNGIKKAARWVHRKVLKPVGRFVKKTGLKIADGVTSVASMMPGSIGAVAGLANKGIKAVRGIIDKVPAGKVKDKLQQGLDKAESVVDKGKQVGGKIVDAANGAKAVVTNIQNRDVGGAIAAGQKVAQTVSGKII